MNPVLSVLINRSHSHLCHEAERCKDNKMGIGCLISTITFAELHSYHILPFEFVSIDELVKCWYPKRLIQHAKNQAFTNRILVFVQIVGKKNGSSLSFDHYVFLNTLSTSTHRREPPSKTGVCKACHVSQRKRKQMCGRCKSTIYCSDLCQQRHWNIIHKHTCRSLKRLRSRFMEDISRL